VLDWAKESFSYVENLKDPVTSAYVEMNYVVTVSRPNAVKKEDPVMKCTIPLIGPAGYACIELKAKSSDHTAIVEEITKYCKNDVAEAAITQGIVDKINVINPSKQATPESIKEDISCAVSSYFVSEMIGSGKK
jgi:hypothetical protein